MAFSFLSFLFGSKSKVPSFMNEKNECKDDEIGQRIKVKKLKASWWRNDEFAILIEGVYSRQECMDFIKMSDKYLQYSVNENEALRTSSRAMIDSHPIVQNIYERIEECLPSK